MRPRIIENLITSFQALPGIGPKTAEKLSYALLKKPREIKEQFAASISAATNIKRCQRCFDFSLDSPCARCRDTNRDQHTLCVVADPQDITAIEKTNHFSGYYHVLGGLVAPIEGVVAKHLTIDALKERIRKEEVKEIILAFDQTAHGEITTRTLSDILKDSSVTITVLARGLPLGSDIEYADNITLASALDGRKEIIKPVNGS